MSIKGKFDDDRDSASRYLAGEPRAIAEIEACIRQQLSFRFGALLSYPVERIEELLDSRR